MTKLCLTQDPDADALLEREPLALLLGMLLDQQVPLQWKHETSTPGHPVVAPHRLVDVA
ncbi:MAG TPA: hypothetical protein VEO01_35815 [Pseudonocardiaceae bacterium]|nr:hypothetical protein [Pseudonocardiaceae bacterium]